VGETVELLESEIGVVLAVLGVTGNLDGDDVLGHVLAPVCAERGMRDPGTEEAPRALYSRQRGSSRSANRLSYSGACSARMWTTITSNSLMCATPRLP
jgi:hypothetical protein